MTMVFLIRRTGYCLTCLLYTSDAADERSSVDLGGRRIINKKKIQKKKKKAQKKKKESNFYRKESSRPSTTSINRTQH